MCVGLRAGGTVPVGRQVPGEDAEGARHAWFLPWCPSQLSPSFLGDAGEGNSRKPNALHNFEEEVEFLFYGAGRGR